VENPFVENTPLESLGTPSLTARTPETAARAAAELFQSIYSRLANRLRKEQIQTWFHRVSPLDFDGHALRLAVPSEFHRTWIIGNYLSAIQTASLEVLGFAIDVHIHVDPEKASLGPVCDAPAKDKDKDQEPPKAPPVTVLKSRPDPRDVGSAVGERAPQPASAVRSWSAKDNNSSLSLNANYVFENFVVGPCNRFAYAGAMGVAERPGTAYNPLFLHGSVGLGKTHLLQAICRETLSRSPETHILYLSCETFTNHFIAAIEKGALEDFRRRYRGVDILVVDDVQFLANKERTQEEFFHTFNTLFHDNKQIVLSSDSPAHEIPSLQERLVSRFKWGLEAEIEKPCFETRLAILQRKARILGATFPEDVLHHLAERVTNNIRELEGAINRVWGYSGLQRETITIDLVRRIMPELDAERTVTVRFEDIANVVAKRFQVRLLDLQSRRRSQSIAFPRQVAMFLSRKLTKHSLVEIGAYFGGRDHTTVLYGIEKIEGALRDNSEMRETVGRLNEEIGRLVPRGA
jgi:chromosomal replication initiator protein